MKPMIACLLTGMMVIPNVGWAQAGGSGDVLQDLPADSTIRLILRDGTAVSGRFVRESSDAIFLGSGRVSSAVPGGAPWMSTSTVRRVSDRRVERTEVSAISVLKVAQSYRANGATEPQKVARVVHAVGAGRDVTVRTTDSPLMKGRLREVDNLGFTIQRGRETTRVPFDEVQELKASAGLPGWAKGAIVVGAASGGAVLIYVLHALSCDGC